MASFSSEIIGRDVVDLEGAMFGVVTDLRLTPTTGVLTHVLFNTRLKSTLNACLGARATASSKSL